MSLSLILDLTHGRLVPKLLQCSCVFSPCMYGSFFFDLYQPISLGKNFKIRKLPPPPYNLRWGIVGVRNPYYKIRDAEKMCYRGLQYSKPQKVPNFKFPKFSDFQKCISDMFYIFRRLQGIKRSFW